MAGDTVACDLPAQPMSTALFVSYEQNAREHQELVLKNAETEGPCSSVVVQLIQLTGTGELLTGPVPSPRKPLYLRRQTSGNMKISRGFESGT